MRTPSPLLPAALCLALLASACGDATDPRVDDLAAAVRDGADREAELRDRVEQLEGLLAEDADAEDPLTPIREQLSELRAEVEQLATTVADGEAARSDELDGLGGDVVRLDRRLGELQGELTAAQSQVAGLTSDLNLLEKKLENHSHG